MGFGQRGSAAGQLMMTVTGGSVGLSMTALIRNRWPSLVGRKGCWIPVNWPTSPVGIVNNDRGAPAVKLASVFIGTAVSIRSAER